MARQLRHQQNIHFDPNYKTAHIEHRYALYALPPTQAGTHCAGHPYMDLFGIPSLTSAFQSLTLESKPIDYYWLAT